jgi:hypothetical protein
MHELEVQGRLVWYTTSKEQARTFPGSPPVPGDAAAVATTILHQLGESSRAPWRLRSLLRRLHRGQ